MGEGSLRGRCDKRGREVGLPRWGDQEKLEKICNITSYFTIEKAQRGSKEGLGTESTMNGMQKVKTSLSPPLPPTHLKCSVIMGLLCHVI